MANLYTINNGAPAQEVRDGINDNFTQQETDTSALDTRVVALEGETPTYPAADGTYLYQTVGGTPHWALRTYDYITVQGAEATTNTYVTLANLTTSVREAGVYEIKFSITFTYDSTNKSAHFRWTLNGGTPEEFRVEPKDATDKKAMTYEFPFVLNADEAFDILLEGKCESATGETLHCDYTNIIVERKS